MAVGKRGTSPSCTYVMKIGMARPTDTMASAIPKAPNSDSGRSAR